MDNRIYFVYYDAHEWDDIYGSGGYRPIYISHDKQKVIDQFKKYVEGCKKTYKDIEIEMDTDEMFSCYSGKWSYTYSLCSLELDKDLYLVHNYKFE